MPVTADDLMAMWATVQDRMLPAFAPVASSIVTYIIAMKKFHADEANRRASEQRLIHRENAEQTDAMTRRFEALMESYQARVDDLNKEVISLRKQVGILTVALDRQRTVCSGCDRLATWSLTPTAGN
jgi:hypothetical protein